MPVATIFSSVPQFLFACAVLVLAQAVYVLFGFGAGLIAVGGLALLIPELQDVVVMLLLLGLPGELFVVSRSRGEIDWRGVALLCSGVAAGIPVGAWLLRRGDAGFMLSLLGVFLVVAGGGFLSVPGGRARRVSWWASPPIGMAAGVLAGLFGTGGPPLILYYRVLGVPKAAFRGNLMAIFLAMTLVRIPIYAWTGLITGARLASCVAVLPAVLVGAWLGHRIHVRVAEETFRRAVSVSLLIIGVLLLVRSLR